LEISVGAIGKKWNFHLAEKTNGLSEIVLKLIGGHSRVGFVRGDFGLLRGVVCCAAFHSCLHRLQVIEHGKEQEKANADDQK